MRDVAPISTHRHFSWLGRMAFAVAVAAAPLLGGRAEANDAQVRVVTYGEGEQVHFAASILPSANDQLLSEVAKPAADIVVVVDTSASQSGEFRRESFAAAKQVIKSLRSSDRVQIFAADVAATPLSSGLSSPGDSAVEQALNRLNDRLPLGHTNMISIIESVRGALVATPPNHTRSIVYIGDATSVEGMANEARFAAMVDALRADHVSVHSVAVGPTTNLEMMGVLANHTGGIIGVVNATDGNTATAIARRVAESATLSPIWLDRAELTGVTTVAHGKR